MEMASQLLVELSTLFACGCSAASQWKASQPPCIINGSFGHKSLWTPKIVTSSFNRSNNKLSKCSSPSKPTHLQKNPSSGQVCNAKKSQASPFVTSTYKRRTPTSLQNSLIEGRCAVGDGSRVVDVSIHCSTGPGPVTTNSSA
ncbi:hypothetical protein PIB30_014022 [Stylosanthes scabra]|uniref:Secreted protein n=1 Tax=Stylosanthes scabra TaxID=79078 RepID=A0ABU6Z336_9FABA|nr:hypothetical protein [Stylosanthes scabra]